MRVYLDNAATTKTDEAVLEIMRIYENEYFGGEYGITSYFNDGTKNILVFNNNGEPDKTRNFQLKKVINHNR